MRIFYAYVNARGGKTVARDGVTFVIKAKCRFRLRKRRSFRFITNDPFTYSIYVTTKDHYRIRSDAICRCVMFALTPLKVASKRNMTTNFICGWGNLFFMEGIYLLNSTRLFTIRLTNCRRVRMGDIINE